jgi:fused signal recognition particle receptor
VRAGLFRAEAERKIVMSETTTLEVVGPEQPGSEPMKQIAPFAIFREQAEKLKVTAETLTITDINDTAGMKLARATRLALREVRIAIDKRRRELGEHHLRATQQINADAKTLRELIEPLEARLEDQEKFVERELTRLQNEKRAARVAEITPFLAGPLGLDVGLMIDADYAALLDDAKGHHAARLAREQKEREEAERIAREEAAAREAQRLENERLKAEAIAREEAARKEREAAAAAMAKERAEAAERERVIAAKAKSDREEAERKAAAERARAAKEAAELRAKAQAEADKARREREAAEAALRAEQEAIRKEADRKAQEARAEAERHAAAIRAEAAERERAAAAKAKAEADKARKERERIEAQFQAEREAREKIEAQLAEEKAAKEREVAAQLAAPDKEKLRHLANTIRGLHLPILKTDKGIEAMVDISAKVENFAAWIQKKAEAL